MAMSETGLSGCARAASRTARSQRRFTTRSVAALWSRTTVWPLPPARWTSSTKLRPAEKSALASPTRVGNSWIRVSNSKAGYAGRLVRASGGGIGSWEYSRHLRSSPFAVPRARGSNDPLGSGSLKTSGV